MWNPKLIPIVCVDFETIEIQPDGSSRGSTEAYRDNFRVDSAAFSWLENGELKSEFVKGEEAVGVRLQLLQGIPLLAHNIQFEMLVAMCRYPQLNLNWAMDSMRLAQVFDNGGDKFAFETIVIEPEWDDGETKRKKQPVAGLGLVRSCKRIMGEEDHKEEAYKWLRANGVKKGKEGENLNKLPPELLERYNVGDTEATLRLANYCLNYFNKIGYDYETDHKFYLGSARRISESKRAGILVDRASLRSYSGEITDEIARIGSEFAKEFVAPIAGVERQLKLERIRKLKTLKGRKKYIRKAEKNKDWPKLKFNPGSNRQLALLFVDNLGVQPFFLTEKGAPSFRSSHLYQYGDGGKLLESRRKRQIVLKQAEALLEKSAYDGRWHVDLKAAGTVTGRFAGGGGLNVQALARRDKGLMSTLVPDPGYIFVSNDISAGEPSIITQYTKDPYYKYFCFDGIGKQPFYDKNQVLMIDDIYLAFASVCDIFKEELRAFYDAGGFDGWLTDPEAVKDKLKRLRKNSKWITLAFGYGLGPKTLYKKAIEAGLKVDHKLCRQAFNAYWSLFSGIKDYATRLEEHVEVHSWFQNDFGYRFVPTEKRKSFNGMIQSSVSSIFHWYSDLMQLQAPYAKYITTIHDENIWMIPIDKQAQFKQDLDVVVKHINAELNWDVQLRLGMVCGNNLYEAK